MNLWGNMLPQNGACNHFFPSRLGEIGTKVHFLLHYRQWISAASCLSHFNHAACRACPGLKRSSGANWNCFQHSSAQRFPRMTAWSTIAIRSPVASSVYGAAQNTLRLFAVTHEAKRWAKAGGVQLKTMFWSVKDVHHLYSPILNM